MYCDSLGIIRFVMNQHRLAAKIITAKYKRFNIIPKDNTAIVIIVRHILYWYIL